MREILFRGKDVKENWHIGLLAHIGNAWYISNKAGVPTAFEVIPSTISQFTGLTDKNGTKIFESDICQFYFNQEIHVARIAFHSIQAKYVLSYVCKEPYLSISEFNLDEVSELEVIGNIYDNPELLTEDDV